MERTVTPECLAAFEQYLRNEEKSNATLPRIAQITHKRIRCIV